MEHPGIVQHHLIASHKQKGGGKTRQVAVQRRTEGIVGVVGVAFGIKLQQLRRHGGVGFPVFFIGRAGAVQIRPG